MSRLLIFLIILVSVLIGGTVLLAQLHGEKAQVRVEKVVPLASLAK